MSTFKIFDTQFKFKTNFAGDPDRDIFKLDTKRCTIAVPQKWLEDNPQYDSIYKVSTIDKEIFLPCYLLFKGKVNDSVVKIRFGEDQDYILLDERDLYIVDKAYDTGKIKNIDSVSITTVLHQYPSGFDSKAYISEILLTLDQVDPWEGLSKEESRRKFKIKQIKDRIAELNLELKELEGERE